MRITCYTTGLPQDHTKVLAGDYATALAAWGGTDFDIADTQTWGASTLDIKLATNTRFDYCKTETTAAGVTFYYFMTAERVTPTTMRFYLSLDVWGTFCAVNGAYGGLETFGTLVQGHELLANSAQTDGVSLPVDMVAGRPVSLVDVFSDTSLSYRGLCVVAKYTVKHLSDQYQNQILVYSPQERREAQQNLSVLIEAYGTVKQITYGTPEKALDVVSVDGMFLIPAYFLRWSGKAEQTVKMWPTDEQAEHFPQGIGGYMETSSYTRNFYFDNMPHADASGPFVMRVGNMGTFVDVPFIGRETTVMPSLYLDVSAGSASIAFRMRFRGADIDMLASLSVTYPAIKIDTPQSQRAISDAVSMVSGTLSVVGSAAAGNPIGVIGGVAQLGATAAGIMTRMNYKIDSVQGGGLINTVARIDRLNNLYINGVAVIIYDLTNRREVLNACNDNGFSGMYRSTFNLTAIPASVGGSAVYRRFGDPVTAYIMTGASSFTPLPSGVRDIVIDILRTGYWTYDSVQHLNLRTSPTLQWVTP